MTDTIDLLETLGSDATLRYASAEELRDVLAQAQASVELTEAAALGDSAPLRRELKLQQSTQVQQTHAPGHEGEDEEEFDPSAPEPLLPDESPCASAR